MRRLSTLIFSVVILGGLANEALGQNWNGLDPIFEKADEPTRENFYGDYSTLLDDFEVNNIDLQSVIDEFFASDIDDNAFVPPLEMFTTEWGAGADSLSNLLSNGVLGDGDAMEVMDQYMNVNEVWDNSQDSFNTIFQLYNGPTLFSPEAMEERTDRYNNFTGLRRQSISILQRSVFRNADQTEPMGLNDLEEALNIIFGTMFDLELAFGKEAANVTFYSENYSVPANVIRVGSVPSFTNTWEARWNVQVSFMNVGEMQQAEAPTLNDGLNPLRYGGNFSFMFNPGLGRLRTGGQFRLYTSIGMEIDSYVPAHINPENPSTLDNVGKTTGIAPQIGSGFIVNTDLANFYTYFTMAYGGVANCPDYFYNAHSFTAGFRFGDAINLQYDTGSASWANENNKSVNYQRFTLGLILDELFR